MEIIQKCLEGMSQKEEGPGGDDIDTEEELVGIPLPQKDQGVKNHTRRYKNGIPSTLDPHI